VQDSWQAVVGCGIFASVCRVWHSLLASLGCGTARQPDPGLGIARRLPCVAVQLAACSRVRDIWLTAVGRWSWQPSALGTEIAGSLQYVSAG
jgi:hypothetical protein